MKLHRKIKHNENVCRAHDLGSTHKVKVVVALLFYVHVKHLRSCRDGQLT